VGYRRELSGQQARTLRLACASILGGIAGAVLLLSLPASAFKAIVPVFIALALILILIQPRLSAMLAARRSRASGGPAARETAARDRARSHGGPLLLAGVFAAGVYGGYFGAAQGILLLALLTLALEDELQRINALKVVLTGLVNLVSGIVFVLVAHVAWAPAGLIAAGSVLGGIVGARAGRRLPPPALRAVIVVVGIVAIVRLVA
jgi:uncharacterized membrane protein YfcA